jgi:hypothetical protein
MTSSPGFERIPDHFFQVREKIFVIDNNEFDIWEAQIKDVQSDSVSVHYPEFPDDDEVISDLRRLLTDTRVNRRIFNAQEAKRQVQLPPLSDGEEEPFSDRENDDKDIGDYDPNSAANKHGTKSRKGKKPKAGKLSKRFSKAPPEGVRRSPRRSG